MFRSWIVLIWTFWLIWSLCLLVGLQSLDDDCSISAVKCSCRARILKNNVVKPRLRRFAYLHCFELTSCSWLGPYSWILGNQCWISTHRRIYERTHPLPYLGLIYPIYANPCVFQRAHTGDVCAQMNTHTMFNQLLDPLVILKGNSWLGDHCWWYPTIIVSMIDSLTTTFMIDSPTTVSKFDLANICKSMSVLMHIYICVCMPCNSVHV